MKILFFSIHDFEKPLLEKANLFGHQISFSEISLNNTTVSLCNGFDVISIFTTDDVSKDVIIKLHSFNIKYICIRAAGYDNVDLEDAKFHNIVVANVPKYSPNAIAEHTIALILNLSRHIILADYQVHKKNFLIDKLIGNNVSGKTVGIIGTGKIGSIVAKILLSFDCKIIAFDVKQNKNLEKIDSFKYVSLDDLYQQSDIITLHTPLTPETRHLINHSSIQKMKKGVILINTARGAIVNTIDLINNIKSKKIGSYGADVYENERELFFKDWSEKKINDELFLELIGLKNVLITPHQAFATEEALYNIACTTMYNIDSWSKGEKSINELVSQSQTSPNF